MSNDDSDKVYPWLFATRIIAMIIAAVLFLFGVYNINRYLMKQKKSAITVILFYVAAFLSIISTFIYCIFALSANTCKFLESLSLYATIYTNMIMGVCQASMLTILAI